MRKGALRAPEGTVPQAEGKGWKQKRAWSVHRSARTPCGEAEQQMRQSEGPHHRNPGGCYNSGFYSKGVGSHENILPRGETWSNLH